MGLLPPLWGSREQCVRLVFNSFSGSAEAKTSLAKSGHETLSFALPEGKKIQVSCRSKRFFEPSRVEHRSLEDEAFLVRRHAQPEEKSFQRVLRQHTLEIRLVLPRHVLEPRTH